MEKFTGSAGIFAGKDGSSDGGANVNEGETSTGSWPVGFSVAVTTKQFDRLSHEAVLAAGGGQTA